MITAAQYVEQVRDIMNAGTPYRHQGRTRAGVDCIGLAILAAAELGLQVDDFTGYKTIPDKVMMGSKLMQHCEEVTSGPLLPGYLLWIRFVKDPQHIAVVAQNGNMIHCYNNVGHVVEHRISAQWQKRIIKVFRIKGIQYE